jgi:hypothetical protein
MLPACPVPEPRLPRRRGPQPRRTRHGSGADPAHLGLSFAIAGALLVAGIVVFGADGRYTTVAAALAFVCFVLAVYVNMPGVRSDGSYDASSDDADHGSIG